MSDWPSRTIGSLGNVVTGSTPRIEEDSFYGGDIPFVTPAELDGFNPITGAARSLTEMGSREVRLLPPGAVMVCCIGSLGKVGIAGRVVATNQQINSVVFDTQQVWPRFGFHACRLLKRKLEAMAPATTVPIVSKSKFGRLEIPVPPLSEQRRIAAVLDKAEELRAKRSAAIAQLDALIQATFFDLFRNPKTNARRWQAKPLGELVSEFRYGTSNKAEADGRPTLRIPNVVGGTIDLSDLKLVPVSPTEFERLRLVEGDVLFVRTNGNPDYVGRCAVFQRSLVEGFRFSADEFIFASYLIRARLRLDRVNPIFIREFMLSPQGRRELRSRSKTSAGQFNINTESLGAIMTVAPPVDLQREFARRVAAVEKMRAAHRASLAKMDALFTSLQFRAFRGEL